MVCLRTVYLVMLRLMPLGKVDKLFRRSFTRRVYDLVSCQELNDARDYWISVPYVSDTHECMFRDLRKHVARFEQCSCCVLRRCDCKRCPVLTKRHPDWYHHPVI
jgi:hypothetical protein